MAERFCIQVAGLTAQLQSVYEYARTFCAEYVVPEPEAVDMLSISSPEQIAEELAQVPGARPEAADTLCLYRGMAEQLPRFDAFVFHGASISWKDKGYLFTAPSGTGKSTHIRLWRKYLDDRMDIVNGDKPVLRLTEEGVNVCSTPWAGKENWHKNRMVPLAALCILHRGTVNRIRRVDPAEYLEELMCQIYLPQDGEALGKTLELLDQLCRRVPVYLLECDISEEAVRTAFSALTGELYPGIEEGNSRE